MRARKHTQPDRHELAWLLTLRRALRAKELALRFNCSRAYIDVVAHEAKQNAYSVDIDAVISRCLTDRLK